MAPRLDIDYGDRPDLRAHYEDVVASTLSAIGRHIRVVAAIVTLALVAAALLVSQLPRKYSAEVLVHPDVFLRDDKAKRAPFATIEGASLVGSEIRLIRSPAIVRTVVKRLGLDEDPEFAPSSSVILQGLDRLQAAVLPETAISSPFERAVSRVHRRVVVSNDTRSYLISISFTASSPQKAANVANAFALEYLKVRTVQQLADAVATANRELAQRSVLYGERHPSVVQAKAELESARSRLQAAANRVEAIGRGSSVAESGGITLAEPDPTPSGPSGLMILGLTFIGALVCGIGLAIWLDRRDASSRAGSQLRTGGTCR
jgi:succinoglycan biosynthesis transport protein ExoP